MWNSRGNNIQLKKHVIKIQTLTPETKDCQTEAETLTAMIVYRD